MGKQFFEVFPSLKLDKKDQALFEGATVERVSATKSRELIRVTFISDHLIRKENVFQVEQQIKKQFFSGHSVRVKLYERFHLSSQYTPQKLMDAYRDSILLELKAYSPVEYSLFKKADLSYPLENTVELTLEDTVPARERAGELVRILEKILNERCGFGVSVSFGYKEKQEDLNRQEDDLKIAGQIGRASCRERVFGLV